MLIRIIFLDAFENLNFAQVLRNSVVIRMYG